MKNEDFRINVQIGRKAAEMLRQAAKEEGKTQGQVLSELLLEKLPPVLLKDDPAKR